MTETKTEQNRREYDTRAHALMLLGGLVTLLTLWHALNNGLTLVSAPSLPWYEFWLPMISGGGMSLYGFLSETP